MKYMTNDDIIEVLKIAIYNIPDEKHELVSCLCDAIQFLQSQKTVEDVKKFCIECDDELNALLMNKDLFHGHKEVRAQKHAYSNIVYFIDTSKEPEEVKP